MRDVCFQNLPVDLWLASREHADDLLRELSYASGRPNSSLRHDLPPRLTALMLDLTDDLRQVAGDPLARVLAAQAAGIQVLPELVISLPPVSARAVQDLADLFDEADSLCGQGTHMLTMPAPRAVAAFRRWYFDQIVTQLDGQPPLPWQA